MALARIKLKTRPDILKLLTVEHQKDIKRESTETKPYEIKLVRFYIMYDLGSGVPAEEVRSIYNIPMSSFHAYIKKLYKLDSGYFRRSLTDAAKLNIYKVWVENPQLTDLNICRAYSLTANQLVKCIEHGKKIDTDEIFRPTKFPLPKIEKDSDITIEHTIAALVKKAERMTLGVD